MKPLTKKELAELMHISRSKLQKLLNEEIFKMLKETGYSKNQRILTPKQVSIINDYWGEFNDDY